MPERKNDKSSDSKHKPSLKYRWAKNVNLQARAMVLADKTLFLAGPIGGVDSPSAFEGKDGIVLRAVDGRDGRKLAEHGLDAIPVHDGMAAANGRLYIATLDGRLLCLGTDDH